MVNNRYFTIRQPVWQLENRDPGTRIGCECDVREREASAESGLWNDGDSSIQPCQGQSLGESGGWPIPVNPLGGSRFRVR